MKKLVFITIAFCFFLKANAKCNQTCFWYTKSLVYDIKEGKLPVFIIEKENPIQAIKTIHSKNAISVYIKTSATEEFVLYKQTANKDKNGYTVVLNENLILSHDFTAENIKKSTVSVVLMKDTTTIIYTNGNKKSEYQYISKIDDLEFCDEKYDLVNVFLLGIYKQIFPTQGNDLVRFLASGELINATISKMKISGITQGIYSDYPNCYIVDCTLSEAKSKKTYLLVLTENGFKIFNFYWTDKQTRNVKTSELIAEFVKQKQQ